MFNPRFYKLLRLCCITPKSHLLGSVFPKYGLSVETKRGQKYAWREGYGTDAPLFVCHVDTVEKGGESAHAYHRDGNMVTSLALDDRLGLALILYSLETMAPEITPSILICDDEEIGRSSAQLFEEAIAPNWLMEFDRRGTDAVLYDYDSTLWRSILTSFDFTIGNGTFSDISSLGALGVCGVNVGVGYHREHTLNCHADLADTWANYSRAMAFYGAMHGVRLEWEDSSYGYGRSFRKGYVYDSFDDFDIPEIDSIPEIE